MIYTRGGWACTGLYHSWFGRNQAKSVVDGIPYYNCKAFPTSHLCWQRINDCHPGVECETTLRLFKIICPENMTNLDIHLGPKSVHIQKIRIFATRSGTNIQCRMTLMAPLQRQGASLSYQRKNAQRLQPQAIYPSCSKIFPIQANCNWTVQSLLRTTGQSPTT